MFEKTNIGFVSGSPLLYMHDLWSTYDDLTLCLQVTRSQQQQP